MTSFGPPSKCERFEPSAAVAPDCANCNQNCNHARRRAPPRTVGPFDIVPGEALAEDTRFELVRGCPQHAFQLCWWRGTRRSGAFTWVHGWTVAGSGSAMGLA
jgi:hypothetical protein